MKDFDVDPKRRKKKKIVIHLVNIFVKMFKVLMSNLNGM